jgi:single-strand DNA-binding protein
MYNKAFLIGRLTRDPEMRMTMGGVPVTRFTIAVDRVGRRKDQENNADFIRVVTWRRLAEICNEYLKKGKLVSVEGRLEIDPYEKDGEKLYYANIVADNMNMLDRAGQPVVEVASAMDS